MSKNNRLSRKESHTLESWILDRKEHIEKLMPSVGEVAKQAGRDLPFSPTPANVRGAWRAMTDNQSWPNNGGRGSSLTRRVRWLEQSVLYLAQELGVKGIGRPDESDSDPERKHQ